MQGTGDGAVIQRRGAQAGKVRHHISCYYIPWYRTPYALARTNPHRAYGAIPHAQLNTALGDTFSVLNCHHQGCVEIPVKRGTQNWFVYNTYPIQSFTSPFHARKLPRSTNMIRPTTYDRLSSAPTSNLRSARHCEVIRKRIR